MALRVSFCVLPIFDVDRESLRRQEPKPLQSLWVQTHLRKRVVPVGEPEVHDHEAEVVSECVRDEEPLARQILEPYLRLCSLVVPVDQREAPVLYLAVDIESPDVLAAQSLSHLHAYLSSF